MTRYDPRLPCKIYVLIDPRSLRVRYIGTTQQDIRDRLAQHWYEAINGRGGRRKRAWLARLDELGLRPQVMELDRTTAAGADDLERSYIAYYRAKKYRITNESAGGKGASHKQRKRDRAARAAGMRAYRQAQRKTQEQ